MDATKEKKLKTMIAKNIRQKRQELRLSQRFMAEKIGLGNPTSFVRIEKGTYCISVKNLMAICEVFECSAKDIIGF
jgi:DNA-binding XRE family transcriptional regulator